MLGRLERPGAVVGLVPVGVAGDGAAGVGVGADCCH